MILFSPQTKKRFCYFLFSLFLISAQANAQALPGKLIWQLAPQDDQHYNIKQLSEPGFNASGWVKALVPGTVFNAYVIAGKEKNPDYAENIYRVDKAKYNRPFWYRSEFTAGNQDQGKTIWLNFNGVNKAAEVYLNGRHLGTVKGLVQRASYDITSLLNKRQKNVLLVLIIPPSAQYNLANRQSPTYLSSGSWDWMPSVPGLNSGLTDTVSITATGPVRINDPWVHARLTDLKTADLKLQVNLQNASAAAVTGVLKARINPGNISITSPKITIDAKNSKTVAYDEKDFAQLKINNPKLWWPNGYGAPNLYTCQVWFEPETGTISDRAENTFGIRKISADSTALKGPWRVYVNDVPVLIKGGNWGMSDYMLKVRDADYDMRIRLHKEMNFNMIRNWTGEITDDAFYQYCDKYGIMVWEDFWLNNFGPVDSVQIFKANAIEKVRKLRNHPSVVIWCGANEGLPGGGLNSALNEAISEAITENDAGRLYFPRSNAGVNNPNFSIHGGSRNLSGSGIWANEDPKKYFTDPRNGYLFSIGSYGLRSELGTASFVNVESFKKFMPPDYWVAPTPAAVDSKTNMWARHYFSTDGGLGGGSNPVKYINDLNKEYGQATSLEDFCKKAQLLNVETTKAMFESWNDHLWHDASGMLMWMSQSAYPSMIWQTYDYYFDLTGAYFGSKTACEPVHIQWNPTTNEIKIINTTAGNFDGLTAEASVYNMDGKEVAGFTQRRQVNVLPTSATEVFKVFGDSSKISSLNAVHFLKLKLMDRGGKQLSENFYWIGRKYLDYTALSSLPSVKNELKVSSPKIKNAANGSSKILTYSLDNQSKKAAAFGIRAILVDAKGNEILPAIISDGYFPLMQGERKNLQVEVAESLLKPGYHLQVTAYNN